MYAGAKVGLKTVHTGITDICSLWMDRSPHRDLQAYKQEHNRSLHTKAIHHKMVPKAANMKSSYLCRQTYSYSRCLFYLLASLFLPGCFRPELSLLVSITPYCTLHTIHDPLNTTYYTLLMTHYIIHTTHDKLNT